MVTKSDSKSTSPQVKGPEDAALAVTSIDPVTFNAGDMREISTIEDAFLLLRQQGVKIDNASEAIGDGFPLMKDKERLLSSPLLLLSWSFQEGDQQPDPDRPGHFLPFVAVKCINQANQKFTVTDGSTGICRQLAEYTAATGKSAGMFASRGLRKSEYDLPDGSGGRGTTYYIDTAV